MRFNLFTSAAIAAFTLSNTAFACSVPVFRYALERWEQDNFVALVFYRDSIGGQARERLDRLAKRCAHVLDSTHTFRKGDRAAAANLLLRTANLDQNLAPFERALFKRHGSERLPWVVVRFPLAARVEEPLWAGPASELPVRQLTDSPARAELARRLIAGESVVWVALQNGPKADKRAIQTLARGLDSSRASLKLPAMDQNDIQEYLKDSRPTVRMEFSTLMVDQADTAELLFVRMLRQAEPMLARGNHQTALFPVFGRGRALYALAGGGISTQHIVEANAFLVGPCACTVKEQNPGKDLLVAADWDGGVEAVIQDKPLPPLQGLSSFLQAEAASEK